MATQTPRVPGIGKASKTEAIRALKYTTFQELALALDTAKTEDLEATVVDFHQWIQWTDCTTPLQEEVQTTVLFDLMRDDPLSKRLGRLWDQLVQRGPASTLASELPFICAAVLQRVYRTEFHQHGLRLAQTILDNYLDLLYRLLNSDPDSFDQPGAAKAVLELLRTMATYHLSLAQTLVRSFDFSFKKWQALMERRESNPRYAPHLPIQANVPIQKTVLLDRYVVENMDTRTVFVRFVMAFFIHGDATTKEFILGKHPLMSALVDGLSADAYETILHALLVLHDHVLADPTVTSDLRVSFLKGRCMNSLTQHLRIQPIKLAVEPELLPYLWATEGVSPHLAAPRVELDPRHPLMGSLINNAEGSFLMDNSVDLVERFLLRVFTVPQFALGTSDPGWYPLTNRSGAENIAGSESKGVAQGPPGSEWDESSDSPTLAFRPTNLALYHFIHNAVRPTTGVRRRDFFLTLVRACPDQLYFYTQSAQLVLEPHLNVVYLSTVALLLKLIQLPNPHAPASSHSQKSWAPTGISTKPPPEVVLIANVMPTFLNREILNRGLLHPSSLVVYNTQLLLAAVLQKLGRVLTWIDNQVDRMQSSTLTSAEGITEWLRVRKQLVNHVRTHLPDFDKVTYIQSQFLPAPARKAGASAAADTPARVKNALIWEVNLKVSKYYQIYFPELTFERSFDYGLLLPSLPEILRIARISLAPTKGEQVGGASGTVFAHSVVVRSLNHILEILHHLPDFAWTTRGPSVKAQPGYPTWTTGPALSYLSILLLLGLVLPYPLIIFRSRRLVAHLLGQTVLFRHRSSEIEVWIQALEVTFAGLMPSVGVFVDASFKDRLMRGLITVLRGLDESNSKIKSQYLSSLDSQMGIMQAAAGHLEESQSVDMADIIPPGAAIDSATLELLNRRQNHILTRLATVPPPPPMESINSRHATSSGGSGRSLPVGSASALLQWDEGSDYHGGFESESTAWPRDAHITILCSPVLNILFSVFLRHLSQIEGSNMLIPADPTNEAVERVQVYVDFLSAVFFRLAQLQSPRGDLFQLFDGFCRDIARIILERVGHAVDDKHLPPLTQVRAILQVPLDQWSFWDRLMGCWMHLARSLPSKLIHHLSPGAFSGDGPEPVEGNARAADEFVEQVSDRRVPAGDLLRDLSRLAPPEVVTIIRRLYQPAATDEILYKYDPALLAQLMIQYLGNHHPYYHQGAPGWMTLVAQQPGRAGLWVAQILLERSFDVLFTSLTTNQLLQPEYQDSLRIALDRQFEVYRMGGTEREGVQMLPIVSTVNLILDMCQRAYLTAVDEARTTALYQLNLELLGRLMNTLTGNMCRTEMAAARDDQLVRQIDRMVDTLIGALVSHPIFRIFLEQLTDSSFALPQVQILCSSLNELVTTLHYYYGTLGSVQTRLWQPTKDSAMRTLREFLDQAVHGGEAVSPIAVGRHTGAFIIMRLLYNPTEISGLLEYLLGCYEQLMGAETSDPVLVRALIHLISQIFLIGPEQLTLFQSVAEFRRLFSMFIGLYGQEASAGAPALDSIATVLLRMALPPLPLPRDVTAALRVVSPAQSEPTPRSEENGLKVSASSGTPLVGHGIPPNFDARRYMNAVLDDLGTSNGTTLCQLIRGHAGSRLAFAKWVVSHPQQVTDNLAGLYEGRIQGGSDRTTVAFIWVSLLLSYTDILLRPSTAHADDPSATASIVATSRVQWAPFATKTDRKMIQWLVQQYLGTLLTFGASSAGLVRPHQHLIRPVTQLLSQLIAVVPMVQAEGAGNPSGPSIVSTVHAALASTMAAYAPTLALQAAPLLERVEPLVTHWLQLACVARAADPTSSGVPELVHQGVGLAATYWSILMESKAKWMATGDGESDATESEGLQTLLSLVRDSRLGEFQPLDTETQGSVDRLIRALLADPASLESNLSLMVVMHLCAALDYPSKKPTTVAAAPAYLASSLDSLRILITHKWFPGQIVDGANYMLNLSQATAQSSPAPAFFALVTLLHSLIPTEQWQEADLRLLLPFYSATRSIKDQLIRDLLFRFERETGTSMIKHAMLWGPASRTTHWASLQPNEAATNGPSSGTESKYIDRAFLTAILKGLDHNMMKATLVHFPLEWAIDSSALASPLDLVRGASGPTRVLTGIAVAQVPNWISELLITTDRLVVMSGQQLVEDAGETWAFDPAFILPLSAAILACGALVPPTPLISSNLAGPALLALASNCISTRKAGYHILEEIYNILWEADHPVGMEMLYLLSILKATLNHLRFQPVRSKLPADADAKNPDLAAAARADQHMYPQLAHSLVQFLAQGTATFSYPSNHEYKLLMNTLLENDRLDLFDIPLAAEALHPDAERGVRGIRALWVRFLADGLGTSADVTNLERHDILPILLSYFAGPIAGQVTKLEILRLLAHLSEAQPAAITARLMRRTALLPWLQQQTATLAWRADNPLGLALIRVVRRWTLNVSLDTLNDPRNQYETQLVPILRAAGQALRTTQRMESTGAADNNLAWYLAVLFEIVATWYYLMHARQAQRQQQPSGAAAGGNSYPVGGQFMTLDTLSTLQSVLQAIESLLGATRDLPALAESNRPLASHSTNLTTSTTGTTTTTTTHACLRVAQSYNPADLTRPGVLSNTQVYRCILYMLVHLVGQLQLPATRSGRNQPAVRSLLNYVYVRALRYHFDDVMTWLVDLIHSS